MDTKQIYTLVNDVTSQALGSQAIKVVDAQSLVSLGNTVLSSASNTDAFLNVLAQKIGKTIFSYRKYENKFKDFYKSDFEFGAIVQKLKVSMIKAESDEGFDLTDGESVDHYKVSKPVAKQKLFITRTPYQFHITIQDVHLREAFNSESGMGSFISMIFGEVQNSIEIALENLGRTTQNNFIAEISGTDREIKLVTLYNTEMGLEDAEALTAVNALQNPDFLRFAVATINQYSDYLTDMSTEFNADGYERHTPKAEQRLRVLSKFERILETVVQYSAFHKEMVSLNAYTTVNFWQSTSDRSGIKVKRASDGKETTVNNIVAVLYDNDALGMYKESQRVRTTPINAAGEYYNQYWHLQELWFNDLSENGLIFTLN